MRDLPPWRDWSDHEWMKIIAYYRHWFLFDENGQPRVVKRRKVIERDCDGENTRELMEEEVCDLMGDDKSMTEEARAQLRLDWAERTGWQKANPR